MKRALRLYARERPQDWRGFLRFLVAHGFTGMIVEATNGPWVRVADAIHLAGLEVGISLFPHSSPFVDEDGDDEDEEGRGERELRRMLTVAKDVAADELHADPENGYAGAKTAVGRALQAKRRRQFADALDACEFKGDVVVTSYPSFPIQDFVREGIGASVQVYDRFDNQPLTFVSRWIKRWRELGFQTVRAGVGIYRLKPDGLGAPKPIARQQAYLASFPPDVDGDVWTLRSQQLEFRKHAEHYRLLRDFAA